MKWLKLDCDFSDDPKIQALCREWGSAEAISFWTLLLAFVGRYGGRGCRVKIDPVGEFTDTFVASKMMTKPQVLFRRLSRVALLSLICPSSWEQKREIFIPNMLKRVDEYTRKLRTVSQTKVHVEEDKEIDKEEERRIHSRFASAFNELWEKYPVKDGRKEAERHFAASVKTEQDLTDIRQALDRYLTHLAGTDWKRPKNGKTWFNNWRDWVNWTDPAKVKVGAIPALDRPVFTAEEEAQMCQEIEELKRGL